MDISSVSFSKLKKLNIEELVKKVESATSENDGKKSPEKIEKEKDKDIRLAENLAASANITPQEIKQIVLDFVDSLKDEFKDSPTIKDKLDGYVKDFDVEKFIAQHPEIKTYQDVKIILFNEKEKFL